MIAVISDGLQRFKGSSFRLIELREECFHRSFIGTRGFQPSRSLSFWLE